jgi:CxxC motif-containing protein
MQDIMKILKETKVKAPVKRGDVVIQNILDTGSDIIATRSVNRKK